MANTLLICESTTSGVDRTIISSLIQTHSLLPTKNYEFHTVEVKKSNKTGSIDDIFEYIKVGLENQVRRRFNNVLFIVDADSYPYKRYKELKACFSGLSAFKIGGFRKPLPNSKKINVGIFLFPNNQHKGSLESLCLKALKNVNNDKMECVNKYFNCLSKKNIDPMTINNTDKSKFRVYHTTPNPDGYVHDLLKDVDINSLEFNKLKDFIKQADR